ncbi:MAG: CopG family transcriptional regulator [Gemmatimonadales bacterium]
MARNLKNITVTLDEETARWARIEAARRDSSVSRFLGDVLRREMEGQDAYDQAMTRYLGQEATAQRADALPLPTRDELHDRTGLR